VLRLIEAMLKAGSYGKGRLFPTERGTPQGGVITPLTQKVISSSNEQSRDGERDTRCLIFAVRSNTVMTYDALGANGKSSAAERCSSSAATQDCASRSCAAFITRLWIVRASSISLPGRSLPTRESYRSSRGHGADYFEASTANCGAASEACEKQRFDHGSHRDPRVERVSAHGKETWLSRVGKAAHFKFTLPIHLIACSSPSLRRPMTFLCPVVSASSAQA
jgi:hypothetical protein